MAVIVDAWVELPKGCAVIWKKPIIVEIALGGEINSYAVASRI
jgi:coenzyme PQQ precursor peptide PqqA